MPIIMPPAQAATYLGTSVQVTVLTVTLPLSPAGTALRVLQRQ
jgi:hypothetical protein